MSQNLTPQREQATQRNANKRARAALVGHVFIEGGGQEHGHAELFADDEEGEVVQGQAAAAVRFAGGRVEKLGLVAAHDAQQVDAAHYNAGRRQEVGVVLAQDAVEQGAELDGGAGLQREALGAGPYENSRLRHAVQQLVLVLQRLRLNLPEVARNLSLANVQLAAEGEGRLPHRSQQLVRVLRRLRCVVSREEQSVCVTSAGAEGGDGSAAAAGRRGGCG